MYVMCIEMRRIEAGWSLNRCFASCSLFEMPFAEAETALASRVNIAEGVEVVQATLG